MARERLEASESLRVVLYEPSGLGGICHYTYQLAEGLAARGCDVTVVTSSPYELDHLNRRFRLVFLFRPSRVKKLIAPLVRLIRPVPGTIARDEPSESGPGANPGLEFLRSLRRRLLYARMALGLLRRRPHVVHFQSVSRGRDLPLVHLLRALGFRTLYTAHDLLPHDSDSISERDALTKVYQTVDRIIVHAERNREDLVSLFGVAPRRIGLVPHGSYDFLLPEGGMSREDARMRLGLPAGGRVVLFFGLIKRYKGLEYLLEAFGRIEKRFPDARLVIVGGLFKDADGYRFYRTLLEEASRRRNVTCVIEYVPLESVGSYLCAADVVALPYTKTYQSGVLLAAYAAGRPVVVTDTGGLSEVVEHGKTGLVVPPREPVSLAAAISQLLEDPRSAEAMGRRASELSRTTYSWDRIAGETMLLYRSIADGQSSEEPGILGQGLTVGESRASTARRGGSA